MRSPAASTEKDTGSSSLGSEADHHDGAYAAGWRHIRPPLSMFMVYGSLLLALAAGCGSGVTEAPVKPPEQETDPKVALRQAVFEILRLESAAFTLEHLRGTTALIPGFLEMNKVSGVVDIPDRFRLKVQAESLFPPAFVEINIVVIEDRAFMTDPGTGRWSEQAPESLPINLSNLGRTLANIIEAVEAPTLVGSEELKGYDTYRIGGGIKSQNLSELVPGADEGLDVRLDLWLDRVRSLLLQVLITGRVVSADAADTVRLLTLDDINLPVEISPPG